LHEGQVTFPLELLGIFNGDPQPLQRKSLTVETVAVAINNILPHKKFYLLSYFGRSTLNRSKDAPVTSPAKLATFSFVRFEILPLLH
jgi:hypothetical protein